MIRCIKFRRFEKNTLRGFADLELTKSGLVIRDCTLHEKNDKQWVGFPARQYTDKDGNTQWSPCVEFNEGSREARELFQHHAIAAIHDFVGEPV